MASKPTKDKLEEFSRNHYTYINQVFGVLQLRKDIVTLPRKVFTSIFPESKQYNKIRFETFDVSGSGSDSDHAFDGGIHHVVYLNNDENHWCSVDVDQFQNTLVNKYDTLCQSYSLLKAVGGLEKYKPDAHNQQQHRDIQFEMIKLYRKIVNYKGGKWLKDWFKKYSGTEWQYNNERPLTDKERRPTEMIKSIKAVLKDWENFGYHYFIGLDGNFNAKNVPKPVTKTRTVRAANGRSTRGRAPTRDTRRSTRGRAVSPAKRGTRRTPSPPPARIANRRSSTRRRAPARTPSPVRLNNNNFSLDRSAQARS